MTSPWDGSRNILGPSDLDEMEVLSSHLFSVGVPVRADPEFKAFVFAAAAAHSLGNRTVDSHLRRKRDALIESFAAPPATRRGRLAALLGDVRECAEHRIAQLSNACLEDAAVGLRTAANTLIRLESTFRAASQLIRLGFAFEAEAVIRLGFEQVAWAQAIADATSPEDIQATPVKRTVQRLQSFLPDAGRIYNRLSDLAHMAPSTHARFLGADRAQRTTIGIQLPEATLESIEHLIVLLDVLLQVSDLRFAAFGLPAHSFDPATRSTLPTRPALKLTQRLAEERQAPADPKPWIDELFRAW